jgi:hypothetical protein
VKRGAAFATIACSALGGALLYAIVKGVRSRYVETPLEINLDHGLADCPWPIGVDPLDPTGEVKVEDRYLILRDNKHVGLAERVVSVICYSAYLFGPEIRVELRTDRLPRRTDPAPTVDPSMHPSNDNLRSALIAYRVARSVIEQFRMSDEEIQRGRQSLDHWYTAGDFNMRGEATLGYQGTLASGGVLVQVFYGPKVTLGFSFRTDVSAMKILQDSYSTKDAGVGAPAHVPSARSRICLWMPEDGGFSWQPPPRTQAEIDESWFRPCPPVLARPGMNGAP